MNEKIIFKGEKKCNNISIEFSCNCGQGFEIIINSKKKDTEVVESELK